jgi:hypothetical protein
MFYFQVVDEDEAEEEEGGEEPNTHHPIGRGLKVKDLTKLRKSCLW